MTTPKNAVPAQTAKEHSIACFSGNAEDRCPTCSRLPPAAPDEEIIYQGPKAEKYARFHKAPATLEPHVCPRCGSASTRQRNILPDGEYKGSKCVNFWHFGVDPVDAATSGVFEEVKTPPQPLTETLGTCADMPTELHRQGIHPNCDMWDASEPEKVTFLCHNCGEQRTQGDRHDCTYIDTPANLSIEAQMSEPEKEICGRKHPERDVPCVLDLGHKGDHSPSAIEAPVEGAREDDFSRNIHGELLPEGYRFSPTDEARLNAQDIYSHGESLLPRADVTEADRFMAWRWYGQFLSPMRDEFLKSMAWRICRERQMLDILRAQPSPEAPESAWIAVEKELPKDRALVRVCNEGRYQSVCTYRADSQWPFQTHSGEHFGNVTHWKIPDWPAAPTAARKELP